MAADDLTTPLGLKRRSFLRLPFGLIGIGLFALIIAIGILWSSVVDDPLGGEPVAVIPIEKTVVGLSARDIAAVDVNASNPEILNGDQKATEKAQPLGPRFEETTEASDIAQTQAAGLSTDPDPRVLERSKYGDLPKVADDGTRPLDVYARRVTSELTSAPRIAIIINGIGLSDVGTEEVLSKLPPEMTLAFAPYGDNLKTWMQRARTDGHELLLQLPMEPYDYPDNDPGPHALLVNQQTAATNDQLGWLLSRITNYVGVVNYMGARYTASDSSMQNLLGIIGKRGLMYVDDGTSSRSAAGSIASSVRTPFSKVDVVLDSVPKADEIDARLLQLEALARARGIAVASASALPVTIKQLQSWSRDLEQRGLLLVPISATIDRNGS